MKDWQKFELVVSRVCAVYETDWRRFVYPIYSSTRLARKLCCFILCKYFDLEFIEDNLFMGRTQILRCCKEMNEFIKHNMTANILVTHLHHDIKYNLILN